MAKKSSVPPKRAKRTLAKKRIAKAPTRSKIVVSEPKTENVARRFVFLAVVLAFAVVTGMVIKTGQAATFQGPTNAPPQGNIPVTIWNRNATGAKQTGASIDIDGDITTDGHLNMTTNRGIRVNGAAATAYFLQNNGAGLTLNVGIGQPSPISQLDILETAASGWAVMRINQSNATRLFTGLRLDRSSVEKWFVGMNATDDMLRLRRSGTTDDVVIDTTGKVGIGVTPNARLDVGAEVNFRGIGAPALSAAGQGRIYFDTASSKFKISENAGAYANLVNITGGGGAVGQATFWSTTSNLSGDNNFFWDNAAKRLGVGTNAPSAQMHVKTGVVTGTVTGGAQLVLESAGFSGLQLTGANANGRFIDFGDTASSAKAYIRYNDSVANGLIIGSNSNPTIPTMILSSGGSVGIGAPAPGYKLDVRETSATTAMIRINNDNAAKVFTGTRLDRLTVEKWFVGMNATDDKLRLRRNGAADDVIIDTTGNVNVNGGGFSTYAAEATPVAGTIETAKMCLGTNATTGNEAYCRTSWPMSLGLFVGFSAASTGIAGGYTGANAACNTAQIGSHVCEVAEMMNTINQNVTAYFTGVANGTDMWINGGPPGFTAPANDCVGWTDASSSKFGRKWRKDVQGGQGTLTFCNQPIQFACCK